MGGSREVKALRKDGVEVDIELALSEAITNGIRVYTAIIQDISEKKKMEEKAKQDTEEMRAQEEELRQKHGGDGSYPGRDATPDEGERQAEKYYGADTGTSD